MRKNRGFTLVELMVTLAVAAVVLGIAVPSFTQSMRNNNSIAAGSELSVAINYARSEAVKRAKRVSLCASSDGLACLAADNWKEGWMVFVDDAATDGAAVTVGTVLRYWDELPVNINVSAVKGASINIQYLRYTSTGVIARLNGADIDSRKFTVYVDGCIGKSSQEITIGLSGMVNPKKIDCP
jgi:type IV fimbrial biogenesis protein FimT